MLPTERGHFLALYDGECVGDLPGLITSVAAVIAAIATLVVALRTKRAVTDVKHEVRTMNEQTIGQLGAAAETRRIEEIPMSERTPRESRHMDNP